MQFSHLQFTHPHILHTSDELSRSNLVLQPIIPKMSEMKKLWVIDSRKKLTAEVHPKCVKCWGVWNANMRIAFLFADALHAFGTLFCEWLLISMSEQLISLCGYTRCLWSHGCNSFVRLCMGVCAPPITLRGKLTDLQNCNAASVKQWISMTRSKVKITRLISNGNVNELPDICAAYKMT